MISLHSSSISSIKEYRSLISRFFSPRDSMMREASSLRSTRTGPVRSKSKVSYSRAWRLWKGACVHNIHPASDSPYSLPLRGSDLRDPNAYGAGLRKSLAPYRLLSRVHGKQTPSRSHTARPPRSLHSDIPAVYQRSASPLHPQSPGKDHS